MKSLSHLQEYYGLYFFFQFEGMKKKKKKTSSLGKHWKLAPFKNVTLIQNSLIFCFITERIKMYVTDLDNRKNINIISD